MKKETIRYTVTASVLGEALVARSEKGICAVYFADDAAAAAEKLQRKFPAALCIRDDAALEKDAAAIRTLAETPAVPPALPLDIRGTDFQREVWAWLKKIPPGTTWSYGDIARKIGRPRAQRAVAAACAANPHAIITPCHRVVRGDGSLSGYRWGAARKKRLLEMEGASFSPA